MITNFEEARFAKIYNEEHPNLQIDHHGKQMFNNKRLSYPLELIKTGLEFLFHNYARKYKNGEGIYDANRSMFVYCLTYIEGGYIPLNREYKPIGMSYYMKMVDYEDYAFLKLYENQVKLKFFEHINDNYYLFDDASYPCNSRLKKLYLSKILCGFPELKEVYKCSS